MNYDTGAFESAHKFNVKGIFRLTNKSQDAANQMLRHLANIETCNVVSYVYDKTTGSKTTTIETNPNTNIEIEMERAMHVRDEEDKSEHDETEKDSSIIHEARAFVVIPKIKSRALEVEQDDLLQDLLRVTGVAQRTEVLHSYMEYVTRITTHLLTR